MFHPTNRAKKPGQFDNRPISKSPTFSKAYSDHRGLPKPNLGYAKDPFQRSSLGLDKDYTKFIKWTPRNIAIAALILGTPYAAVVTIVAVYISWMAALPFLILLGLLAAFIAALYGLARISL